MSNHEDRPLQELRAPDLWPRIIRGLEDPPAEGSLRGRRPQRGRLVAAAVAFAVAAAGIGLVWTAFGGRSHPSGRVGAEPPLPKMSPITVAASFTGAPARCTATLLNPVLRPGQMPVIRYRLMNVGTGPLRFGNYLDFPSVTNASGTTAYTWEQEYGGAPVSPPTPGLTGTLRAGKSTEHPASAERPVIRWSGPLALHLTCPFVIGTESHHTIHMLSSPKLPPLPLHVFAPGGAPTEELALARALSATGGLFSECRPGADGEAAVGRIVPPEVAQPPKIIPSPMPARCWASLERDRGFDVMTLVFVSPPEAALPSLGPPGSQVTLPDLPTVEVVRWTFVVTPWSTAPALGPLSEGKSATPTVDYSFTGGRWIGGGESCQGGTEYYSGGGLSFPVPHNPC